ncbi:hypothetical protein ACM64Y_11585 [Novispirillum sp. DQ9]|uniref:hypothetical protein n=1 Tax=Novispirillum sp. DQ9 TaxID=3398612 RepID=UPI003C7C2191
MKAFALGAVFAALFAVLAAVVLQTMAAKPAYQAYSSPYARVGHDATADARGFMAEAQ